MILETKPASNATSDIIAILYRKTKALEDYHRCLDNVRDDTRLTQILIQLRHDDERHIKLLRSHLGRLLANENAVA